MGHEDVTFLDGSLITASWTSTIILVIIGITIIGERSWRKFSVAPIWLNVVLIVVVAIAAIIVSIVTDTTFLSLPYWLFRRVWTGHPKNACLQLFFLIQLIASVLYVVGRPSTTSASSAQRKFFHLTISFIAVVGLFFDPSFTRLAAHLMLQIFIIIELLRSLDVPPWADALNPILIEFIDTAQESQKLIMTPIFLITGIFLPLFLSRINPLTAPLRIHHFAGVATVGVGDSLAAIIGSKFGRIRLPQPFIPRKSLEGSLAMFFGQAVFYGILLSSNAIHDWHLTSLIRIFFATIISTGIEAALPIGDNLVLPLVSWIILD